MWMPTPEQINDIFSFGTEEDQALLAQHLHPLSTFEPRPDCPSEFDQQTSFLNDNKHKFTICLGGTGSGKTITSAVKTARYVLNNPPPRPRCPFWIIGDSFDQVCQVAWVEKLSTLIPRDNIADFDWYKTKREWPFAVMLKHQTMPNTIGWILEFRSYEQGLKAVKSASIGGYWCNEEIPFHHIAEIQGRCRDYGSPGWADFTPVECKDPEWPEAYNKPPRGWKFYHLNTSKNLELDDGWWEDFIASVPEDMRELRTIGRFTILAGAVFKEWDRTIHVIEPFKIPRDWRKIRGMDFGFNNPTSVHWVAKDHDGIHYVYDEHYDSGKSFEHHAAAIGRRAWDESQPWFGPTYSDHDSQHRNAYANLGIHCTPANKEINHGIEFLRSLMMVQGNGKPKFYVFNTCKNLIREIPGYRWQTGTATRNPQDVPMDINNHACDSIRYACFSDHIANMKFAPQLRHARIENGKHGVYLARRR